MNIIQTSTNPVRIRIETETDAGTNGNGGGNTGQDFALASIGEQYALFVLVEETSDPPQNG
jgi:hypothetical protein